MGEASGVIRLGIVGAGAVARHCHLPALASESEPFRLGALVDRTGSAARAAADAWDRLREREGRPIDEPGGPPLVTTDLGAALPAIDAAIVATANDAHAEVAVALLEAGKHVLIEKPMATTVRECARIRRAARDAGAVLSVGHVRRLFPMAPWIRAALAAGMVGAVREVHWREGKPFDWPVASDFTFRAEGGGLLADIGPHVFDLLLYWFGGPERVIAYADNAHGGVESELRATLEFGPVRARVELSRIRWLPSRCVVTGERGTLTVGTGLPGEFELRDVRGTLIDAGAVPVNPPSRPDWAGVFAAQLRNFAEAINGGAAPMADGAAGAAAVRIIERCDAVRRGPAHRRLERPWERCRGAVEVPRGLVAVTGATGFIGSCLVERLIADGGQAVAVAHRRSRLSRLCHLDNRRLRYAVADVLDVDALVAAFTGCDTVVHTVYGNSGTPERRWAVSVDGTGAVLEAAGRAGVRRLVHVSTSFVYDTTARHVVDEDCPVLASSPADLGYAAQKLAAERLLQETRARLGLETVCLQPAVVYGPWAPSWTMAPLRRLRSADVRLPSGETSDTGVCNAVHVADVADALLFAASAPAAAGRTLLVSGPETVGWGRFYDSYRELLGLSLPGPGYDAGTLLAWEPDLYASRAVVRLDRIAELGWRPQVGFAEGMEHVGRWARWAGVV